MTRPRMDQAHDKLADLAHSAHMLAQTLCRAATTLNDTGLTFDPKPMVAPYYPDWIWQAQGKEPPKSDREVVMRLAQQIHHLAQSWSPKLFVPSEEQLFIPDESRSTRPSRRRKRVPKHLPRVATTVPGAITLYHAIYIDNLDNVFQGALDILLAVNSPLAGKVRDEWECLRTTAKELDAMVAQMRAPSFTEAQEKVFDRLLAKEPPPELAGGTAGGKPKGWKPPKNYTGAKSTGIPRSTLEEWEQQDDVPGHSLYGKVKRDPSTRQKYYPDSWRDEFAECFQGRLVCIIPDKDKAGGRYAERIKKSLRGIAADLRIATVPGEYKDITDFIESRDAAEPDDLKKLIHGIIDSAEVVQPDAAKLDTEAEVRHEWVSADQIQQTTAEWIYPARVPKGEVTVFGGNSSTGKTSLALNICATVSVGGCFPDGPEPCERGSVLYLTDENSKDKVLVRVLKAMGADLHKIRFHHRSHIVNEKGRDHEVPFVFTHYQEEVERQLMKMRDVKLIVIDPLISYMDPRRNLNDLADMSAEMGMFRSFAEKHSIGLVLIANLNKKFDAPDLYRVAGSTAIIYRSRAAHIVRLDPGDPEEERRQFICVKVFDGKRPPGLVFTIASDRRVVFSQGVLTGYGQSSGMDALQRKLSPKAEQANEFIQEQLDRGPLERKQLFERAAEKGIKEWAIKEAAERLGVVSQPVGFGADKTAMWGLPGADFKPLIAKCEQCDGDHQNATE